MKHYLTISEFAGLRNVNINSIRYYEKLKLLIPAYIDPQTKYRYYLPEQLDVLDTIQLCIKLGIPLKDLKEYVDESGKLDEKGILENGKKLLEERISDIQLGLEITQFNLDKMKHNQKYSDKKGIYTREIEERFFIRAPFHGNWNDLIQKEKAAINLFHTAQKENMAPVFPAGILIHCETEPVSFSFLLQVLHPAQQDERIIHIPKAQFSCLQVELTSQTDILELLRENFSMLDFQSVIISNMLLNKLHLDSRHTEIQVPKHASISL